MSLYRYHTQCITDKTKDDTKRAINYGNSIFLTSSCPYQAVFHSTAMWLKTLMHTFVEQVLEHVQPH
jgi:hypothetical protein